jgi:hypothetical protein
MAPGGVFQGIKDFVVDYIGRHAHPVNAVLHIIGVPMVFYSIFLLCTGNLQTGAVLFVLGYLFQYLGHRAQGNEVGEVILIKNIYRKLSQKGTTERQ